LTSWQWLLVALAGAAGAPARYIVDTLISERLAGVFPLGTLVVNISGSLALGLLAGLAHVPDEILGTGLVGAYTTFSTFSFETLQLLEAGEVRSALTSVVANLAAGTLAAAGGLAIAGR
jgi:fluoride exporter